ncbi:hypothetical protein [Mycobacterium paraintracellulare]|uniref:hypothetical protein n=1 Tax=Mycobacterium paraintracellulare TaxID=1138383 RepID=UPI001F36B99E|nr:hypothetical protein [Mycobacterium paraintracellulare]
MTKDGVTTGPDARAVVQLRQSDWTDQDLLTKDEARERLVEEIARTRSRLEQIRTDTGDPARIDAETTLLTRRLNAMESIRDQYDPPKDIT